MGQKVAVYMLKNEVHDLPALTGFMLLIWFICYDYRFSFKSFNTFY